MSKITYLWARCFGRSSLYRFHEILFQLSLRGLGILNDRDPIVSGEMYFLRKVLQSYTGTEDLILVDVGANHGNYSKLLREYFADARIIAFEPHPQTFKRLAKAANGMHIETVNKAVGATCSMALLYDYEDIGSEQASLHLASHQISDASRLITECEVEVITLDYFFKDLNTPILLLKIDTEGHELECLKGAQNLIEQGRIKIIQFEFNEMNIASRVFLRDFFDLLPDYTFYRLLPHGMVPIAYNTYHEIFKFQNIVAVRD